MQVTRPRIAAALVAAAALIAVPSSSGTRVTDRLCVMIERNHNFWSNGDLNANRGRDHICIVGKRGPRGTGRSARGTAGLQARPAPPDRRAQADRAYQVQPGLRAPPDPRGQQARRVAAPERRGQQARRDPQVPLDP
jgi:hypothetical protein